MATVDTGRVLSFCFLWLRASEDTHFYLWQLLRRIKRSLTLPLKKQSDKEEESEREHILPQNEEKSRPLISTETRRTASNVLSPLAVQGSRAPSWYTERDSLSRFRGMKINQEIQTSGWRNPERSMLGASRPWRRSRVVMSEAVAKFSTGGIAWLARPSQSSSPRLRFEELRDEPSVLGALPHYGRRGIDGSGEREHEDGFDNEVVLHADQGVDKAIQETRAHRPEGDDVETE
ncbi:hypothetical protein K438DRAFT_1788049 [Mycena galopus ATCC 62051]|nr:hypothetical protein K438DRAFT_1788049 [Mycena galopus ATCC 62051]